MQGNWSSTSLVDTVDASPIDVSSELGGVVGSSHAVVGVRLFRSTLLYGDATRRCLPPTWVRRYRAFCGGVGRFESVRFFVKLESVRLFVEALGGLKLSEFSRRRWMI